MTPWYEKSFGREYLELYAHRDAAEARADIKAVLCLLSPPKDEPLLDLCCGPGRHLRVLRDLGFGQLVGLDLSEELLQVAAVNLANADSCLERAPHHVQLVRSDMRTIPYTNYFATVLSLFTSFGYFETDENNHAVFLAIHRALRTGGRVLVDYLNRDYVIANLVERDEKALPGRHVQNTRCLTDGGRRVAKTITVTTRTGGKREFHESVRLYSKAEMVVMLQVSGFIDIHCYGSLDGQAYNPESRRLILIARKKDH